MYSLSEYIPAIYVQNKPYGTSNGRLKVYIPSLMKKIPMGTPKTIPVGLDRSCYNNAADCKPSVASKIDTQNYVTAEAPYSPYAKSCYWFGSDLVVVAKTADCLSCRLFPGEKDNSTYWP